MLRHIRPALVMLIGISVITGLIYPYVITGLAQAIFPWQASGSMIERDGKIVGSALIGQNFVGAKYFHGRPSATTEPDPKDPTKTVPTPYAADNSAGSNLAPTAKALVDRVKADVAKLRAENPGVPVPGDLVTTSGSGLDPTSRPRRRTSRCRAWRRRAACHRRRCAAWWRRIPRRAFWGFLARRG